MKLFKKILPLVILFSTSLTSCSQDNIIPDVKIKLNLDAESKPFIEINKDELTSMIDSKMDFLILIGSITCSYCTTIKNIISPTIKRTYSEVFYFDVIEESKEILNRLNVTITPSLLVVKNGQKTYEISGEKLENENNFKRCLSSYCVLSTMSTMSEVDTLKEYQSSFTDFLFFSYTAKDSYSLEYLSIIYKNAFRTNYLTLAVDYNKLTDKEEFFYQLGVDNETYDTDYLCVLYQDGKIKTTNMYLSDVDGFNDIMINYYSKR